MTAKIRLIIGIENGGEEIKKDGRKPSLNYLIFYIDNIIWFRSILNCKCFNIWREYISF